MVAVIVLAPFDFAVPVEWRAHLAVPGRGWLSDLLLNVVLFLPLGFIGRRVPGLDAGPAVRWLAVGAVLSLAIEVAQLFLAARYPTGTDVLANAVGAWCGAQLSDRAVRGLGGGERVLRRLLLDVPLIGIPYLLIPVLWLDGLSAPGDGARLWLQLPLAAAGGVALAGAARTADAADRALAGLVAVFAAAWWLVAAVPTLRVDPIAVVLGLTVAIVAAEMAEPAWRYRRRKDRRLEPVVVVVVAVLVVLHMVLGGARGGELELIGGGEASRRAVLAWLQGAATFTLLGYLVAEWRGRVEEQLSRAVMLPTILGGGLGMALAGGGINLAAWAPPAVAAGIGAALYVLQRDHVVAVRSLTRPA